MKKIIFFIFTILIYFTSNAQTHCEGFNKCKNDQVEAANKALVISNQEESELYNLHLFEGKPRNNFNKDVIILVQNEFIVGYDTVLNLPLWTSYLLTSEWAGIKLDRCDCFRDDPRLNKTENQINCDYYSGSGFNRGHLSPRNDFNRSEIAQINTFLFSNMVPQFPNHNQSTWMYLEGYVNDLAESIDSIYIVTGIAFDYNGDGKPDFKEDLNLINKKKKPLAIPSHLYKIIVRKWDDGSIDAICFLTPHDNLRRKKLESFNYLEYKCLVSIDEIELISGFNFFWKLQNEKEEALESFKQSDLW
jgi:endonuclease G